MPRPTSRSSSPSTRAAPSPTTSNGYGHVAFCVDDLEAEHARLTAAGRAPRRIVALERDGGLLAEFFFVQDPDGYQIEVLRRHGRYR